MNRKEASGHSYLSYQMSQAYGCSIFNREIEARRLDRYVRISSSAFLHSAGLTSTALFYHKNALFR